MKHTVPITLILISLFFAAQIVGLFTVNKYIMVGTDENGTITVSHPDTFVGEQPDLTDDEKTLSFLPIMLAILMGTALIFVLIKFNLGKVWKFWFLFAVTVTLAISFEVYLTTWIAVLLAIIIGAWRIFRPNPYVHNLSEVFIYTGITILILPWLNIYAGVGLLLLISVYDAIAVWKSKHMVKLAKFQIKSRLFAGLSMNYRRPDEGKAKADAKPSNAILGGGDIAFPLLFASAVMENLILHHAVSPSAAFFYALLVTAGAGIALSLLLFFSKKDRFYPAMPFISAGCFAGYLLVIIFV